ncbi:MAG: putative Ig domain-containing protein, partial [Opitutaceae bacterium]|nr:putative Ig domain-containing protein [Opitutaceae bacterium]
NTATGVISGTPSAAGASNITISATNAGGTGSATLVLTVNPPAPVITSALSATGTQGAAFSYTIAATNSPTGYGATSLPAGLSVNTATGVISGTPSAAGASNITISATNAGGSDTATLALTVYPPAPVITSATTAAATLGEAFTYTITASNDPVSFDATGLPAGLGVNTATGVISGTPSATGAGSVTISATNAGGSGSATLALTVSLPVPFVTSFAPGEIVVGDGVVLTGGNFMPGGVNVVTDVLFDTKEVGEGNFTVDSNSQITVRAVPGGIPDTGPVAIVTVTGTFAAPAPYVIYTPPPAPLLRYTFEEADGAATSANNGTLLGYTVTTFSGSAKIGANGTGVAGKGRALDLSANQVNTPTSPGAAFTPVDPPAAYASTQSQTGLPQFRKFTLTGWYKTDIDDTDLNGAYLFRHMGANTHIYHRNGKRLQARVFGTDFVSDANADGYDSTPGKWKFFALTWEEYVGAKFYGGTEDDEPVSKGDRPNTASANAIDIQATAGDVRLGHSNRSGAWPGFIDDIRVYDAVLTPAQVRAVYYEGKDAEPDSNVLPYPAAWEASDAGDARRDTAHRAYLALIDRDIAAKGSYMPARINTGYGDGTVAGSRPVSRFTIGFAVLEAYRASLVPADVTGGKLQTRNSYIESARKCLIATLNAAQNTAPYDATTTIAEWQATELSFGLDTTVELYHVLAGLGVFTAPEQAAIEQQLAICADGVLNGSLEYGSFNRASSRGAGIAAVAALPSLAGHAHRANWLQFANAIWNDWRHAAPAYKLPGASASVIDTFEDARGYNGLWASTTYHQAVAMGKLDELRTPETEAFFARFAHLVAPNGTVPEYGNAYWSHGLSFWLSAFESLGQLYGRADFLENAVAVANFIIRNPGMEIDEASALVYACQAVDATPIGPAVIANRPGAVVTTRTTDYGDVLFDKLYLRTGVTSADSYAAVDLHPSGYHGHEDGGALLLHTSGSSVLLHSQARLDTFANEMQGVWATRPGEDFLTPVNRHAPDTPTRWLMNFRFPGTYTGQPVLDISRVSAMFFRAENTGSATVALNLRVLSVKGVKPDGATVDLGLSMNHNNASFTPGQVSFVFVTGLAAPLDLSPYQYLIVEWQSSHPDLASGFFGFNGASLLPSGAADGRPASTTLRNFAGSFTLDAYAEEDDVAPKGGLTRVMLDNAGRQIVHNRDVRLRKADGALLVLDTFEFTQSGSYTVGPVWHVENLVSSATATVTGAE